MPGRKPGHGTDDTADNHGRLSIDRVVTRREITKRDGAGRMVTAGRRVAGGGADHIAPLALAGAGPMVGGADRLRAARADPLMERAGGTP